MDIVSHLRTLFAYDAWANREVLVSLKRVPTAPSRPLKLLAHIVATEWLWWDRLNRQKQRLAVWPEFTLAQSEAEFSDLPETWNRYLADAGDHLTSPIEYVNTKGESWTSTVHDILTHVVIHSAYHRGQIATDLRAAGFDPPYTDYIHATRHQLLPR